MWVHTAVYRHRKRVCTESWSRRKKIPCRTGESNLSQRRASPALYQLSYISTLPHVPFTLMQDRLASVLVRPGEDSVVYSWSVIDSRLFCSEFASSRWRRAFLYTDSGSHTIRRQTKSRTLQKLLSPKWHVGQGKALRLKLHGLVYYVSLFETWVP